MKTEMIDRSELMSSEDGSAGVDAALNTSLRSIDQRPSLRRRVVVIMAVSGMLWGLVLLALLI